MPSADRPVGTETACRVGDTWYDSDASCDGLLQVPMDQAKNALDMITRFTRSEDFGSRDSAKLVTATSRQAETVSAA